MHSKMDDPGYLTCLIGEEKGLFRVSVARGRAEVSGRLSRSHTSCSGAVHRGLIAALLDTAMGKAFSSLGLFGMTAIFKVDYLEEPADNETVSVRARVVREDVSRVVAEGQVRCGPGKRPVAVGHAVFLKSADASGREDSS